MASESQHVIQSVISGSRRRQLWGLLVLMSWQSACLACRKPWGPSPAPNKRAVIAPVCNHSLQEVEAGRSEVQGHP